MVDKCSLGNGYHRLATMRSPPGLPADVKLHLHWMELVHRAEVQLANEKVIQDKELELEYLALLEGSCGDSGGVDPRRLVKNLRKVP